MTAPVSGFSVFRRIASGATVAVILMATAGTAQTAPPAPSFTTCSRDLGDKARYMASLTAEGWEPAPDQTAALAKLRDGLLAAFGPYGDGMDALLTWRAERADGEIAAMVDGRTVLEQNDAVLLLTEFERDDGARRIHCAIALPDDRLTSDAFIEYGAAPARDGIRTLTIFGQKGVGGRDMTISLMQVIAPDDTDPPLAARGGILTRLLIAAPTVNP